MDQSKLHRRFSHINTAETIISNYDGKLPFAVHIQNFFRQHRKYGSSDRREISILCYAYFRSGFLFISMDIKEKIMNSLFLTLDKPTPFLDSLKPEWNEHIHEKPEIKLSILKQPAGISALFPFADELSASIDRLSFIRSFLIQPDLFIRARPNQADRVSTKLKSARIPFITEQNSCFRIPSGVSMDQILLIDKEAVIQDLNSQMILDSLNMDAVYNTPTDIWDCCAGSGGKSILLHDIFPNVPLTVSDIRESILFNLENRFKRARIFNYKKFVADLSSSDFIPKKKYDLILCDAPCSGSGTWSRTPEQILFFKKEKISFYNDLQRRIAKQALTAILPGGYFIYCTCSVFKKENEDLVDFVMANSEMKLISQKYFIGYDKKADTLFVAVFKNVKC